MIIILICIKIHAIVNLSNEKGNKTVNSKPSFNHKILHHAVAVALQFSSVGGMAFSNQVLAEEAIELDSIEVVEKRRSDTVPVKGYAATHSSASTKTDTPLINVPQAITVITKDVLQDQSVQSIAEAVQYVPGVTAAQGEGNRDALIFRGNDTTSDLFIDGMRDDIQTYRDLYNTDRLEVLKGPNGMAFGRGGAGGVINRVSKKAGWDPVKDATVSYGAYNQKRVTGDYGIGLTDDVAFRINGVYEDSDSYRDDFNLRRFGLNPTVTISPDENTKIYLSAEYFKDDRTSDRGVPSVNGANNNSLNNRPFRIDDYSQFFGNANQSNTETETVAFNAIFEHTFANKVKLKNSSRVAYYDKYYENVYASSAVDNNGNLNLAAYRDDTKRENLINQTDITIPFKTGFLAHQVLLGSEFTVQDTTNQRITPSSGNVNVSAANPFTSFALDNVARDQTSDVNIAAFYFQDQVTFSPKWQAVFGVRHDTFEIDYKDIAGGNQVEITDRFWSPRAGLIYKPTTNTSIYGSYSISYAPRAGDQLISLRDINSASFDPEKFVNKEIGAKWDINPNLSFTSAVYILERQNVLAVNTDGSGDSILLDGQETKGVELSLNGKLTDKWQTIAAYAYQDGEITKDQGTGNSAILSGTQLAQTPKNTFSLWNKYDINNIWSVALGIVSRSSMYAATPNVGSSTKMPGYTRYDAAVFAKLSKKATLQLNIENLTNKAYALSAHNNNNIMPGSPLTGRATLVYKF